MNKVFKCCHKCEERYPACHSTCERYHREREKNNQIKANRKKARERRLDIFDRFMYWR